MEVLRSSFIFPCDFSFVESGIFEARRRFGTCVVPSELARELQYVECVIQSWRFLRFMVEHIYYVYGSSVTKD